MSNKLGLSVICVTKFYSGCIWETRATATREWRRSLRNTRETGEDVQYTYSLGWADLHLRMYIETHGIKDQTVNKPETISQNLS